MRVTGVEPITVSVPYRQREVSSQVARDGVTDVLVRVTTDDGLEGWGESCTGADAASIEATIRAMAPFVVSRSPWNREAMRSELDWHGLWQFREPTANFAWAGIDMALWDLCGKAVDEPLYRLLGGLRRPEVTYFYYLARGTAQDLAGQCEAGRRAGFEVFYLKVGIDDDHDLEMVRAVREALGPGPRIRLDANASWTARDAMRNIERFAPCEIDFIEQPVRQHPIEHMAELRRRSPIAIAANEGLWTVSDAYARIKARTADVFCFSPYWVGSLATFRNLAHVADLEGLEVCKHTHGELGVAATAFQHLLLALPNVVEGNQQTAHVLEHDVLVHPVPIATGHVWGVPSGAGLGLEVDPDAVAEAAGRYERDGQYLPYQAELLGREEPD